MSEEFSGRVDIVDSQNRKVFQFDSSFAVLDLGAQGNEADLRLYGDDGGVRSTSTAVARSCSSTTARVARS
jgi:hypothetical protein